MGDRYTFEITCPVCKFEGDAWYAPTCDAVTWRCGGCRTVVDLEVWTGISYEDASNRLEIEEMLKDLVGRLHGE